MTPRIAALLVGLSATQLNENAFAQLQTPPRSFLSLTEQPVTQPVKVSKDLIVVAPGLEKYQEKYSVKVEQLKEGVDLADKFFGQEPGSRVKKIYLHATPRTGTAQYARPSGMLFHIALLASEQNFRYQSFHEYVHLIDDESNFSLSSGRMEELHKRIGAGYPEFFKTLAEKNFLPKADLLGHPEDDSKELVASLVNSLNHPELEHALNTAPKLFRTYYRQALEVLAQGLTQVKSVPKNAPIHARIKDALKFLESLEKP